MRPSYKRPPPVGTGDSGGIDPRILDALTVILDEGNREWIRTAEELEKHNIDIRKVAGFGGFTVTEIELRQGGLFDVPDGHGGETVEAVVIEALAADGETTFDLIAYRIDNPSDVRTLLGRASILGMWEAFNPATYIFGRPLVVRRTPLDWLRADCEGAAIITPRLAARTIMDAPGPIAAQDAGHAAALRKMIQAPAERVKIVIPETRRAA